MSDLISRQAILKNIEKIRQSAQMMDDTHRADIIMHGMYLCEKAVRNQPPAQQWIPCSERLPEEGEVVLTQAKFKDDIKMAVSARVDFNYWTGWGTREINIVAWMPLPEPFKGGDGNE